MRSPAIVVLGLGSNMGDRRLHLWQATQELHAHVTGMSLSPIYQSEALLSAGAPEIWNQPFYNMAIAGQTALSPEALLQAAKDLEQRMGREQRGHWAPREIDVDILAYGDTVIESPMLTIPHKELLRRDFALAPLADVAPEWAYPVAGKYYGKTAHELVYTLGMQQSLVKVE